MTEEIQSIHFLNLLAGASDIFDKIITEDISNTHRVSGGTYAKRLVKNCTFKNFHFPNNRGFDQITFENCRFESLSFTDQSSIPFLQFISCELVDLTITGKSAFSNIKIENGTIGKIDFSNSRVANIDLKNVAHCELISFHDMERTVCNLKINECQSVGSVVIRGVMCTLDFKNSVLDNLLLDKIEVSSSYLILESFIIKETFKFNNSRVTRVELKKIICEEATFDIGGERFEIIEGQYAKLKFDKSHDVLILKGDSKQNLLVGNMDFGKSKPTKLNIKNLTCDIAKFSFFRSGEFSMSGVTILKEFDLEDAIIEKGKFYNVDVSNASIKFLNATLTGSELINVKWPTGLAFYEYEKERKNQISVKEKLDTLWSIKEGYRQMKVLSLSQHNKIDALYFQKHELKTYWNIIAIKTWKESFRRNIGNWFILGTNRLFSDFGQNIWRPLFFLFASHLIWFSILLWTRFDIIPSWNYDLELTLDVVNAYFVTLLPTHGLTLSIGELKDINIGGGVDFCMRVFAGYFIFYFVSASRKFHQ